MEEDSLRHLGNLATMLEDSALFPFVGDIGPELTEGVGEGEEEDFSVKVDDAEDFLCVLGKCTNINTIFLNLPRNN